MALYNLKGGVGKTASAVNLSYLAAADGLKTLVWDIDPQGSSSFYFHAETQVKNESRKIFAGDLAVEKGIRDSPFENLWIIPADLSIRNADALLAEMKQSRKILKHLKGSLNRFDIVLLDCAPGISLLHDNVFNAADWILMPNIPTTLSMLSYETVTNYFEENNLDTDKIKCFFNMVDHRKNLHNEVINKFYRNKVFFKNYIPYLSDVEKMGINRQPVFEFANSSYAAQCYRDLWQEIKKTCL